MNISIALATYNGSKHIKEQLDSISNQTLMPVEIIICDDASEDDTVDIIKSHKIFNLIKLFINEEKLGLVKNFKKAVKNCDSNNYIAFCDQDDIWDSNKLLINYQELKKFENLNLPVLVYSDSTLIDGSNDILYNSFMNTMQIDKYEHNQYTVLFGSLMLGCTIMINTNMRQHFLDMPNSNSYNHDAWLSLVGFYIGKCIYINHKLVLYRKHEQNLTISNFIKLPRYARIYRVIKNIFQNKFYLHNELVIANDFLIKYQTTLSNEKIKILKSFIKLEKVNYFFKKAYFEYVFFRFWIKRF